MARLQILELPEGNGDDRPPFVLVIDQMPKDEAAFEALRCDLGFATAQQIGARAVLVFEDTIDIPANDVSSYLRDDETAWTPADEMRANLIDTLNENPSPTDWQSVAEKRERDLRGYIASRERIEKDRRATLTDALGMDRLRDWDDIRNTAAGLRKERDARTAIVQWVRDFPAVPETADHASGPSREYLAGYQDAVEAIRRGTFASTAADA